jgi:hypothetical protein
MVPVAISCPALSAALRFHRGHNRWRRNECALLQPCEDMPPPRHAEIYNIGVPNATETPFNSINPGLGYHRIRSMEQFLTSKSLSDIICPDAVAANKNALMFPIGSVRVLSRLFRRLFLESLQKAFDCGKLRFFSSLNELSERKTFLEHLPPLRKKEWVVYAKQPFAGPEQVLD